MTDFSANSIGQKQISPSVQQKQRDASKAAVDGQFKNLFDQKIGLPQDHLNKTAGKDLVKFSSHALSRIKERGIPINKELMQKIENAVKTADEKGSKEALMLSDSAAFIVSVPNKTVITAIDKGSIEGNVFTNIDSTIVL